MKNYVVIIFNELTVTREHYHTDALTAQEAVDLIRDRIGDAKNYTVTDVFVESEEIWR